MLKSIQHNKEHDRFEVESDGITGYLSYVLSEGVVEFNHTIVPPEIGGRGIGSELVKYGLAYARVTHHKVIPTCSFVAAYMNKHKIYRDLLIDS